MKYSIFQRVLTLLFLVIAVTSVKAQTIDTLYYLHSDFEELDDQNSWTSEPTDAPNIKWTFEEGGYGNYLPVTAASGSLNALFYFPDADSDFYRLLVSPPIDLSEAEKPQLAFQHAQPTSIKQDRMYLLFKAGPTASWDTIAPWTNAIDNWKLEIYNIDEEGSKYMCDGFQVAFLAYSLGPNGVSVDSVYITEKDTIPKYINYSSFEGASNKIYTSKALQVPLIKVRVDIMGNEGVSNLKNISFVLREGLDSYFKASGFRLFHTRDELFENTVSDTSTQVGSAVSISSGTVTFSGLNHKLKLGTNYLWMTADFADNLPHNSYVEFGVNQNSVSIMDTLFPSAAIDSVFGFTTSEAVFYDNFETLKGWDISTNGGDFEIGVPLGLSSASGKTYDPDYAYSGTKVLGTDLTTDGLYLSNITPGNTYYAESPVFDLKYYDRVKIYMRKWNDFYFDDSTTISVTNDGGSSWHTIWFNQDNNKSFDNGWVELLISDKADMYMSRYDNVKLRFNVDMTFGDPMAGFNIDQFIICGNHLETDVGISQLFSPYDDCIGFDNDTVKIEVTNYAEGASPSDIPVYYALWGLDSTVVRDTIRTSIPQNGSIIFKFSELANFPRGDIYDEFVVGIDLESDEDSRNDQINRTLYIQDTKTPPTIADFEYKGDVWLPSKEISWTCMAPDGSIPLKGDSPMVWALSESGDYSDNDTAYLTSNCYDLTNATRNIVELKYWIESEAGGDGFALELSTDDGASWHLVDTTIFGRNWGWYTDMVSALGHIGWSGNSGTWLSAKELLPDSLSSEPKVKFRIKFISDAVGGARGPAIDDFEIYSAPADVGVSSIASPIDDCELVNASTTSVYVKNYGFNTMFTGDTIIVGVDFESDPSVIDTFSLAADLIPGDSVLLTVGTDIDITTAGTYNMLAYTLIEDDPFLYQTNNDTAWKTFSIWPNPSVILADTIGSRDPDTVNIVPQYPDWVPGYTYEWQPGNVTDSIYDVSYWDYGPRVYHLAVTEPVHSCVTNDSINVLLLYFDAGADEVVSPVSDCELSANEYITVRVKNTGTDSILVGDKIQVHYRVNNGTIFKDTITIAQTLYANNTIDYTFINDPYDFSTIGAIYYIDAWAHFGSGDTTATNDSTFAVVETFGFTPLDLGPDLIVEDTSYTLDAGSGFVSYLWNNGDTTQTTYINTPGKYWIDAWDGNGCPAYDTIDVWFKVRDLLAEALFSPSTDCENDAASVIQFMIRNNGTDTITTAQSLTYSYSLNGGARVEQSAAPTSNILPGASYMFLFSGTIDVSGYQDYNFDLTVNTTGDINTANDTLNTTISTYPNPVVDFGENRVVTGVQELLNADNGSGHTYEWQDNSSTSTYTAIATGTYWCTVTNITTNCSASDTVELTFDYADFSVRDISIKERPCQGSAEPLSVTIEYIQGSNARTSTSLSIGYQTGDDEVVTEDITIDELWVPGIGDAKVVVLDDKPVFSESGNLPIRVYLNGVNDLNPNNDEITRNLDVQAMPVIDYGGTDTMGVYFPYTLDPGLFSSYQWMNGSLERYFTANSTGSYTVTVTNSAGCPAVKTVFLSDGLYANGPAAENLDVKLYPNPASTLLNIEVQVRTSKELTIELMDITNRIVFSENHKGVGTYTNELDVSSVVPGVYFLRISNNEIHFVNRIVIQ